MDKQGLDSILLHLGGGRELSLHSEENPEPSIGCTLHFEMRDKQKGREGMRDKALRQCVSKKEALAGLVKMILYLEALDVVPEADVHYLWELHHQVHTDNLSSSYSVVETMKRISHGERVGTLKEIQLKQSDVIPIRFSSTDSLDIGVDDDIVKVISDVSNHDEVNEVKPCDSNTASHYQTAVTQQVYNRGETRDIIIGDDLISSSLLPQATSTVRTSHQVNPEVSSAGIKSEPVISTNDSSGHQVDKKPSMRKIKCSDCDRTFQKKSCYSAHMRVHLGLPKYQCGICNKTFTSQPGYRIHKMTHQNLSFQCEQCGKSFGTPGNLHVHRLIHEAVKRHPCHLCGKRFTTASNRQKHVNSHNGFKRFQCAECGRCFTRNLGLQRHIKRVHPDIFTDKHAELKLKTDLSDDNMCYS